MKVWQEWVVGGKVHTHRAHTLTHVIFRCPNPSPKHDSIPPLQPHPATRLNAFTHSLTPAPTALPHPHTHLAKGDVAEVQVPHVAAAPALVAVGVVGVVAGAAAGGGRGGRQQGGSVLGAAGSEREGMRRTAGGLAVRGVGVGADTPGTHAWAAPMRVCPKHTLSQGPSTPQPCCVTPSPQVSKPHAPRSTPHATARHPRTHPPSSSLAPLHPTPPHPGLPGVGDGDDDAAGAVVAGTAAVQPLAVAVVEGGGVALHLVAAAADSRRHGGRRERVAGEAGKVRWRGLGGCEGWDWSAVGRVSRDSRWQCAGTRTRLQWQTQTQTQVLVLSGEGQ